MILSFTGFFCERLTDAPGQKLIKKLLQEVCDRVLVAMEVTIPLAVSWKPLEPVGNRDDERLARHPG